jgi:hyperosmotically inducible periplasmic protein
MKSELSHKIIVASGLAVVVAIGAVTFALRSHPATSVAQISHTPAAVDRFSDAAAPASAARVAEAPAPAAAAQISAAPAPAPAAQIANAPASVAHADSAGPAIRDTTIPDAVEPKIARERHSAKARSNVGTSNSTAARTASAVNSSEKSAAATLPASTDGVKSVDQPTMPLAADAQGGVTSTWSAASDSSITTSVKSEIAADSASKDVDIGVSTTNGVVVLTGTLASKDAIEHVKDVAGKVKDVKSVDASALKIANT